ncbi:MAG: hypothetical protein O3B70_06525 [Bacteroidetes bacterium]|nr:hypothetical protein [Bacteroidota bacterium]MDA0903973.1 hypothetical protein [Bacteroidota bacterium]MDA1243153.1 hypothetical protein [Bacteroidota bacterium]
MSTQLAENLLALSQEITQVAGFAVTCTRDCEVLNEELSSFDVRFPVSVSTLRRFFGLIPTTSQFSATTLNALSRYAGYASFRDFKVRKAQTQAPIPSHLANNGGHEHGSSQEIKQQVLAFIEKNNTPAKFQLNVQDFNALKQAVLSFYEAGSFDMGLWLQFKKHTHLKDFVLEQFPPLDFMSSFGESMMEDYLQTARSMGQKMFAQGVIAGGKVNIGEAWRVIFPLLAPIRPALREIHPLIQSRNLGIWLLALKETEIDPSSLSWVRNIIQDCIEQEFNLWPKWSSQARYFSFNISEYLILADETALVESSHRELLAFRKTQDWSLKNVIIESILDLRMVWNLLQLGHTQVARDQFERISLPTMRSLETRTHSMWYHAADLALRYSPESAAQERLHQAAVSCGYLGLERRLKNIVIPRIRSHQQ